MFKDAFKVARVPRRLLALLCVVFVCGCFNPLVHRRAKVLAPGEIELMVSPEFAGNVGFPDEDFAPVFVVAKDAQAPTLTLGARVGLFKNADLQLKMSPGLYPQIDFAYQWFGGDDKLTLTTLVGTEYSQYGRGTGVGRFLYTPLTLLVDIPLFRGVDFFEGDALYVGAGLTPAVSFTSIGPFLSVHPRFIAGYSIEFFDWLIIQPEMAAQRAFVGPRDNNEGFTFKNTHYAFTLGIGARFN